MCVVQSFTHQSLCGDVYSEFGSGMVLKGCNAGGGGVAGSWNNSFILTDFVSHR